MRLYAHLKKDLYQCGCVGIMKTLEKIQKEKGTVQSMILCNKREKAGRMLYINQFFYIIVVYIFCSKKGVETWEDL